eukprot:1843533-Pyramimonas_sp.AAC.1
MVQLLQILPRQFSESRRRTLPQIDRHTRNAMTVVLNAHCRGGLTSLIGRVQLLGVLQVKMQG